jgi:serine/threonine-protein kinase
MPAPTTADQLFDHLRRSGLFPTGRLDEFIGPGGDPPTAVLDRLVGAGLLTRFQADRLAVGKYKGFVLGGYVILDRIGGGGMGHVYLAEHAAMRRHVALKVLASAGGPETVARERFLREARAAAVLNHPNIVRVFDLRQQQTVLYLVMEYIPGVSLYHLVARNGPLDWRSAAHYVRQVALGLQHAHTYGLVHRDIKPANLLVARDGTAKVLDLGLVRWDANDDQLTSRLDRTILGTADYLAPEQAMDSSAVDIRADIYSLGATFYYLLAGRPMFPDGRTAQKLMWQQLREPAPIRQIRPDVPDGLALLLHRALRKDPADRFQEPAELAAELTEWATGPVPLPSPDLLPPPPPRWIGGIPPGGTPGSVVTASCAFIDIPPVPAPPSETAGTTLNERNTPTPRLGLLPECRTPVLGADPAFASGLTEAAGGYPPAPEAPNWRLAAVVALMAIGFLCGLFASWLGGIMK